MMVHKSKSVRVVFLAFAVLAGLALFLACNGGDNGEDNGDGGGNGGPQTFDVSMGDNFFDPNEFTVSAGSEATFNLTNNGAAIHNMRIAGPDGEFNTDDDDVSDPDIVAAGETATLTWTAPGESGEIKFHCDFHPTDMTGTITVE